MDAPADPLPDDKPALRRWLTRRPRAPRRVQIVVAAAAVIALVVLIVVFTSGGETTRDPGAAFRMQAQTICAGAQRQVDGLKTPSSFTDLASVARQAARISGRTRAALAALDPPALVSADMPALLASLKRQQRLANQLAAAAGRRSQAGVRRLIARGKLEDARTGRAAQRVGLQGCATTEGSK